MEVASQTLQIGLAVAIILSTWLASKHWGLLGLLAAHVLCAFCWILIRAGIRQEYEDIIDSLIMLVQVIALNSILLPLGLWGLVCWRREDVTISEVRDTA